MDTIAIYTTYSAICCVFFATGLQIYIKIRSLIKYRVNCWFCNNNTKVSYKEKLTGWNCPNCEQYNGFNKEGDYNCHIPAQYHEHLNGNKHINKPSTSSTPNNTILCQQCSYNLETKVKLLANFVPMVEKDFDNEVEKFSNCLEQAYPLCETCDQETQKKISEKNAQLIGDLVNFKMKTSMKKKQVSLKNVLINLAFKLIKYSTLILSSALLVPLLPESTLELMPKAHQKMIESSSEWLNLQLDIIIVSLVILNIILVFKPLRIVHAIISIGWLLTYILNYGKLFSLQNYSIILCLMLTFFSSLLNKKPKSEKSKKLTPKMKKNYTFVRRLHVPDKSLDKDIPNLDGLSLGSKGNLNNLNHSPQSAFLGANRFYDTPTRTYKINNNIRHRQTLLAQPRLQVTRTFSSVPSQLPWLPNSSDHAAPSRSSSQSSGFASLADLDTLSVKSEPVFSNRCLWNNSLPAPPTIDTGTSSPRPWSPSPGPLSPNPNQTWWTPPYQVYPALGIPKNCNGNGWNSQWSPASSSPWSSDSGSMSSPSSPISPYFSNGYPIIYQQPQQSNSFLSILFQSRFFLFLVGLLFIYNLIGMFLTGYHAILLPLLRIYPSSISIS